MSGRIAIAIARHAPIVSSSSMPSGSFHVALNVDGGGGVEEEEGASSDMVNIQTFFGSSSKRKKEEMTD